MSDRELLEKAAKAAGLTVVGWSGRNGEEVAALADGSFWQPLHRNTITDADGDALRLAVKLGIERIFVLRLGPNGVCVDGAKEPQTAPVFEQAVYRVTFDQYAATRRAIVRAAAMSEGGGNE